MRVASEKWGLACTVSISHSSVPKGLCSLAYAGVSLMMVIDAIFHADYQWKEVLFIYVWNSNMWILAIRFFHVSYNNVKNRLTIWSVWRTTHMAIHGDGIGIKGIGLWLQEVRAKIFQPWFCSETFATVSWWASYARNVKKWGVTDFVLERTCPDEHPKSEKTGLR